jgi:hypothetical protein
MPQASSPLRDRRVKADARPVVMTAAEMRAHEGANILAALQARSGKVFGKFHLERAFISNGNLAACRCVDMLLS